jgi:hypothetical protein
MFSLIPQVKGAAKGGAWVNPDENASRAFHHDIHYSVIHERHL